MKCPKCGYNSFESYNSCRKCSADLTGFKTSHGIFAVVLPPALSTDMAAAQEGSALNNQTLSDTAGDMFSFDPPTTSKVTSVPEPAAPAVPFSFDDTPVAAQAVSSETPPQFDPFASLLESTPQQEKSAAKPPPVPPQGFELHNFSWDDTPASDQPGGDASNPKPASVDDFDSLFGDLEGPDKK